MENILAVIFSIYDCSYSKVMNVYYKLLFYIKALFLEEITAGKEPKENV